MVIESRLMEGAQCTKVTEDAWQKNISCNWQL